MSVRMINVSGEHGKDTDEFETLMQRISDACIQCVVVIIRIGKDTAHHRFHDVADRSLHNYISGEVRGILRVSPLIFFELDKLIIVWHNTHNQQISNFFKAKFVAETFNQLCNFVTAIPQFAHAVFLLRQWVDCLQFEKCWSNRQGHPDRSHCADRSWRRIICKARGQYNFQLSSSIHLHSLNNALEFLPKIAAFQWNEFSGIHFAFNVFESCWWRKFFITVAVEICTACAPPVTLLSSSSVKISRFMRIASSKNFHLKFPICWLL